MSWRWRPGGCNAKDTRVPPGSCEGALGVNDPLALAQRRQPVGERFGSARSTCSPKNFSCPSRCRPCSTSRKRRRNKREKHPHRQEESWLCTAPNARHRARGRRRVRCRVRADDESAPSPKYATPGWFRSGHPSASDRRRSCAASRRRRRTAVHRGSPQLLRVARCLPVGAEHAIPGEG